MPNLVSGRRLYVNADRSKIVDEGDPEASFLLAGEGATLTAEDVDKYELTEESVAAPPPAEEPAEEPVPEENAEKPAATKAQAAGENK